MIPLVTGFPAAFIGAFFAGSLLIETLFSLDGLGLLSYESVVKRDYPVVMGSLYVFTLVGCLPACCLICVMSGLIRACNLTPRARLTRQESVSRVFHSRLNNCWKTPATTSW